MTLYDPGIFQKWAALGFILRALAHRFYRQFLHHGIREAVLYEAQY